MNDEIQEIINYFELEEGYDKNVLITDILGEIGDVRGYSADEIGLEWDGRTLTDLRSFADEFYGKIIEGVCNVLKSY
ncbi:MULTISPECIES: hypothetical protein [unclassified Paenibacillus]|uniref:hypothetical protein n=1 Tax=unclassified Paenibacillus TaxID=185978 RepID=UPI00020D7849|nr:MULTISPECIES: hypothetical protein [unclassified Paenibacillus]EGL19851.1 hypothetical protein HMPREF9413_4812 [Paenibacillus sp. HGF7]EPD81333.1 hypothetical protein HMPREF1207_05091 [Paenibacillus sp. HGH0039]